MSDRIENVIAGVEYDRSVGAAPHPGATVHLLPNEWEAMKEAVKRERPHVYQNRPRPDQHDPFYMHYCAVCNGYYGVPHHRSCLMPYGCSAPPDQCACRRHQEARGLPREGSHGWITR